MERQDILQYYLDLEDNTLVDKGGVYSLDKKGRERFHLRQLGEFGVGMGFLSVGMMVGAILTGSAAAMALDSPTKFIELMSTLKMPNEILSPTENVILISSLVGGFAGMFASMPIFHRVSERFSKFKPQLPTYQS